MKKIGIFLAASGLLLTLNSISYAGGKGDKSAGETIVQPAEEMIMEAPLPLITAWLSVRNGTPYTTEDAPYEALTYPGGKVYADSITCRNSWLNSYVRPDCLTSGCPKWSKYFSAGTSESVSNNTFMVCGPEL